MRNVASKNGKSVWAVTAVVTLLAVLAYVQVTAVKANISGSDVSVVSGSALMAGATSTVDVTKVSSLCPT